MVGIRSFPFGARPIFRGKLAVSFREGTFFVYQEIMMHTLPEGNGNGIGTGAGLTNPIYLQQRNTP